MNEIASNNMLLSDTTATVSAAVLHAIIEANAVLPSYGADHFSREARDAMQAACGKATRTLFVPTGTGANLVALAALSDPTESIVAAWTAHIACDEMMTIEKGLGVRIQAVPTSDGKLTVETLDAHVDFSGLLNRPRPGTLSISQPTEYGTVYSREELRALSAWCIEHRMSLHIDGARLAHAVAHLGIPLDEMLADVTVAAISFGMTKNGGLFGDCVVLFEDAFAIDDERIARLQALYAQLPAKMWSIAVTAITLLRDDLWIEQARHANGVATQIAQKIRAHLAPGAITQPVQANAVFWKPGDQILQRLQGSFVYYDWHAGGEVRTMTSFDTPDDYASTFAQKLFDA